MRDTKLSFIPNAYKYARRVLAGHKTTYEAVYEAYDGIDGFLKVQKKNLNKKAYNPTIARYDEIDTFQYLLYKELEPFERSQEREQLINGMMIDDRLLILRYLKCVIRNSIRNAPFYSTVGICGLIYDFDWKTSLKIYDVVVQFSDNKKDQNDFNLQLRKLKGKLIDRFPGLLEYEINGNDKKSFSCRPADDDLLKSVQSDLALHIPWRSEHVITKELASFDTPIPKLHAGTPYARDIDPSDIEMSVWRNSKHALIDPKCFQNLIKPFEVESLKDKLRIPRFAHTNLHNKTNDSDSGPETVHAEPQPEFYKELFLKERERARKRRRLKRLSVIVDGIERQERFDILELSSYRLMVPYDACSIELIDYDNSGTSIPVAEISLEFYREELEENGELSFVAVREAGQQIEMIINPHKIGDGEIKGYDVVISYSETKPVRTLSLAARRRLRHFSSLFDIKGWKTIGAFAALVIFLFLGGFYILRESFLPKRGRDVYLSSTNGIVNEQEETRSASNNLQLIFPENGAVFTSSVAFRWKPYAGAASYSLIIADIERPDEPVIVRDGLTDTSYRLTDDDLAKLHSGKKYQWEVEGSTESNLTINSSIRTFEIATK